MVPIIGLLVSCFAEFEETPVRVVLIGGQSNAGRGGTSATQEFRQLAPSVLQLAGVGKAGSGWTIQSEEELTDLVPTSDEGDGGQYVATMTGLAIAGQGDRRTHIVRTDWMGGQPLDSFLEGSVNFANTITAVRAMQKARPLSSMEVPWYVWIQGESGPYDYELYLQTLRKYVRSIKTGIQKEVQQESPPVFVIVQTNTGDKFSTAHAGLWEVAMAQWDVARESQGVIMAGPMYHIPMIVDANDNIHSSSFGRMVLGDMLAAVFASSPGWKPLQPNHARRKGRTIWIRFDTPGRGLQWDDNWVPATPNYGFRYSDSDHSARIVSVEIVSHDTVRIDLDTVPTGSDKWISYAIGSADLTLDGWSEERGQLLSPTPREAYFWKMGYPVPRYVNHYAVRFRLAL